MSNFWSIWIIALFVICNAGLLWLLFSNRKTDQEMNKVKPHSYDGIEEYDNPLPSWFFNLFLATVVFGVIYLALFPGLGNYKGLLGWTSINQWEKSVNKAEDEFMTLVTPFMNKPASELTDTPKALKMGKRIFKNNCAICHGVNAKGSYAFPNLTDDDWLYGGVESHIKQSITEGRRGSMPAWASILGQDVDPMVDYIMSLNEPDIGNHPMNEKYNMMCSACHSKDGSGNQLFGAPNLKDDIWLYGGSSGEIKVSIEQGRNGQMPPFKNILTPERIHLVIAYVLSLHKKPAVEK